MWLPVTTQAGSDSMTKMGLGSCPSSSVFSERSCCTESCAPLFSSPYPLAPSMRMSCVSGMWFLETLQRLVRGTKALSCALSLGLGSPLVIKSPPSLAAGEWVFCVVPKFQIQMCANETSL